MLIHTSFSLDDRGGITFLLQFNPTISSANWRGVAHLAWVLNAYMSAEKVLTILNPPHKILHSQPLDKWLTPERWETMIFMGWHG